MTAKRTREHADAGVKRCLDLMTTGRWVLGQSHVAVAEEFDVSPTTARDWATNASRIIRLAVEGDVEDIRAQMLATLGHIIKEAMGYQRAMTTRDGDVTAIPQPDLRSAIAAVDCQAKLLGLMVQKYEVAVTDEEAQKLIADAAALMKGEG